jgi:hypothetical protein
MVSTLTSNLLIAGHFLMLISPTSGLINKPAARLYSNSDLTLQLAPESLAVL